MSAVTNGVTLSNPSRLKIGRPKREECVLQVSIRRWVRGEYVKGTNRTLQFSNAPWEPEEFSRIVERAALSAAGKKVSKKATNRVVAL